MFTRGQILGCCYGVCISIGLTVAIEPTKFAAILILAGCSGLGALIGDMWNEMCVRRTARKEQEIQELGTMLAKSD